MKKSEALKIIVECAKLYSRNLVNQNLLFVCDGAEGISSIETVFLPQNFMHLTGVAIRDKSQSSVTFYNACVNGKLTPALFEMNRDGTTRMKLSVLPQIMNIHKIARMMGDFSENKMRLHTEKIVGNVHACIGFVHAPRHKGFFVPNTVLREDIRDVVEKPTRKIIAVFRKPVNADEYVDCTYRTKDFDPKVLSMQAISVKFAKV